MLESKTNIVFVGLLIFLNSLVGQEKDKDSLAFWNHQKKIGVLLNQASFSNWLAGGVNNFSGTLRLDWQLDYCSEQWEWNNLLDAALGYARTQGVASFRKMDDQLTFHSTVQLRSKKVWNFSSSFQLKTQNAPGYDFSTGTNNSSDRKQISNFFSPAYLSLGVGVTYAHTPRIKVAINPLNARVIVVDRTFTRSLEKGKAFFGVVAGKSARWEAGMAVTIQNDLPIATNIRLRNHLNLVANYLEAFKNVDVDHTLSVEMKVNKLLSALLEFQWVYDDNALAQIQARQVFGMAISLPF